MIGRLTGVLLEKNPPSLLIDVQGVGYEVDAPMSTFYVLPAIGETVGVFTHLVVRDDAHLLFGFATATERVLFRALLKVNGVGAKVALAILSGLSTDIGKKTAERLLIELEDKVAALGVGTMPSGASIVTDEQTTRTQAEDALASLGYKPAEASRLLDKTATADQSVEQMIRAALRSASK
jgi:Holliday junction DNA helicase RuvA